MKLKTQGHFFFWLDNTEMAANILKNGLEHPKTAFFQNKVLQFATDIS